jgi:hypothetical protein
VYDNGEKEDGEDDEDDDNCDNIARGLESSAGGDRIVRDEVLQWDLKGVRIQ